MFERKNYALQVALKKYHKENHTLPERVWCIRYKLLLLFVVNYSTRIGTGGGGGGGGGGGYITHMSSNMKALFSIVVMNGLFQEYT